MTLDRNFSITPHDSYLRIEPDNEFVLKKEQESDFIKMVRRVCRTVFCHNVLICRDLFCGRSDTLELLEFGCEIAASRIVFAVVGSPDHYTTDKEFLENVVWNRGGAIRFFGDEQDALAWLGVD